VTWTEEDATRFGSGVAQFVHGCVTNGFKFPLVATIVSTGGCVVVFRYTAGDAAPERLLDYTPGEFSAPAWMCVQDARGRAGHFTFYDPEPVEKLKGQLFSQPSVPG
jgi:hypothetical protein